MQNMHKRFYLKQGLSLRFSKVNIYVCVKSVLFCLTLEYWHLAGYTLLSVLHSKVESVESVGIFWLGSKLRFVKQICQNK